MTGPATLIEAAASTVIWMPFVDTVGLTVRAGHVVGCDSIAATETLAGALLPELVGTPETSRVIARRVVVKNPVAPSPLSAANQPPVDTQFRPPILQTQRGLAAGPRARVFGVATGRLRRRGTIAYVEVIIEGRARLESVSAAVGEVHLISATQNQLRALVLTRGPDPLVELLPRAPQRVPPPAPTPSLSPLPGGPGSAWA